MPLPRADVAPAALPPARIRHADTLCIIYTSGTTGAPKGVLFTHRMMRIASEATLRVANAKAGDRLFVWEPLCHIGGAQMLMVPFLEPVQLHVVERFSASRFWEQWRGAGATHLHYLGGILDILAQAPQPPQSHIQTAWGAGVAARSWDAIRQRLGCEIRECYGMTECSSFATLNASGKPGSIGRPLPWLRVELLGQDGLPVAPGEAGEIVLSSDIEGAFLPGYLDNPEASRRALRDGRLHTGDSARRDADGDYFSSAAPPTACACAARTCPPGRSSAYSSIIRPYRPAPPSAWTATWASRKSCSMCNSSTRCRSSGPNWSIGRVLGWRATSCLATSDRRRVSN